MAEYPAMPLWTDAYLGDTTHLTTTEHGAYLLLLMSMWRAGGTLPNDGKMLARYARCTNGQWARMRDVLMPFFQQVENEITQSRLTDELAAVRQRSQSQSDNARSKHRKNKKSTPAMAKPPHTHGSASIPITKPITPPDGGAADAAIKAPDLKARVFGDARIWFEKQTGFPEKKVRDLLGTWCRDFGDAETLIALDKASKNPPVGNWVPWIVALLQKRKEFRDGNRPKSLSADPAQGRDADIAAILRASGFSPDGSAGNRHDVDTGNGIILDHDDFSHPDSAGGGTQPSQC